MSSPLWRTSFSYRMCMGEHDSFRGNWELFLSECLLNRYNYLVMLHCLILFPVCVYIFPGQDYGLMVAAAYATLNRKCVIVIPFLLSMLSRLHVEQSGRVDLDIIDFLFILALWQICIIQYSLQHSSFIPVFLNGYNRPPIQCRRRRSEK